MNNVVIAEVSIVPLGTQDAGVSKYVAACIKVLEGARDIEYKLTPMGTVMQGKLDRILQVLAQMHEVPFAMGVHRVVTSLRIDDRRDRPQAMNDKVQSVQKHMPSVKV